MPALPLNPARSRYCHHCRRMHAISRLTLAKWLVAPNDPLTARVTVNRVWQEYFGRGLVRTSEDFGTQGEKPSHPELLDWLAAGFQQSGWSLKKLHKRIVTSATYRQSSNFRPELQGRDPGNTLLARQTRLRLPAELIRDSALAASGLLYPAIGGKSIRPPQPAGLTDLGYASSLRWQESQGRDRYRRGLYILFQRTVPYPQLANFDAPDSNVAACRRTRSNTPLQALNLLNDPVFVEAAQALAARTLREAPAEFSSRAQHAFQLVLVRALLPESRTGWRSITRSSSKRWRRNLRWPQRSLRPRQPAPLQPKRPPGPHCRACYSTWMSS